jgi:hypothetical protein
MWSLKGGLHTTTEPTLRDLYVTLAVLPEVNNLTADNQLSLVASLRVATVIIFAIVRAN